MQSAVKYMYDDANALRKDSEAAVTATGNSSVLAIPYETAREGHIQEPALAQFAWVLNTRALDTADANETYVLTLTAGTDAAMSNEVTIGTITVTATGVKNVLIDSDNMPAAATHLRVTATLGGTTPSITYTTWIAPIQGV